MFSLAVLLATARERLVDTIAEGAPTIKAWGGRILILVGAWFVTLAVFADYFSDLFPV